jgi:hypothetical protein
MMNHGTERMWRDGCRCDLCATEYRRVLAKNRARKERYRGVCVDCGGKTSWSDSSRPVQRCASCQRIAAQFQHGSHSGYTCGCRCDPCRAAHAAYMLAYMRNRRRSEGVLKRRWAS